MSVERGLVVFIAILLMAAVGASPKKVPERWWGHMQALASDETEGREPGTTGYEGAADYVEKQFQGLSLSPAGTRGFRQPVELVSRLLVEDGTSLSLVSGNRARQTSSFEVTSTAS